MLNLKQLWYQEIIDWNLCGCLSKFTQKPYLEIDQTPSIPNIINHHTSNHSHLFIRSRRRKNTSTHFKMYSQFWNQMQGKILIRVISCRGGCSLECMRFKYSKCLIKSIGKERNKMLPKHFQSLRFWRLILIRNQNRKLPP